MALINSKQIEYPLSGSFSGSLFGTSSFALTASYLDNYLPPFPFTGSARITGSLNVIGPVTATGSLNISGSIQTSGSTNLNLIDGDTWLKSIVARGTNAGVSAYPNDAPFVRVSMRNDTSTNYGFIQAYSDVTNSLMPSGFQPLKIEGRNIIFAGGSDTSPGTDSAYFDRTGSFGIGNYIGSWLGSSTLPPSLPAKFNVRLTSGSFNLDLIRAEVTSSLGLNTIFTVRNNGQVIISGSLDVNNGITGSLLGTASYATQALSASFVPNTFVQGGNSFGAQALIGTNDNNNLAFETSGSIRMLISSSGNIGIRTNTPFSDIPTIGTGSIDLANGNSSIYVGGYAVLGKTVANGYGAVGSNYYLDNSNAARRRANDHVSAITFNVGGFDFQSAGTGGVGSSVSLSTLASLNNSGNFTIGNSSTSLGARIGIKGSGATSSTTALRVENSNATASLVVRDDGWVGIGTATPTTQLEVFSGSEGGTIKVSNSIYSSYWTQGNSFTTTLGFSNSGKILWNTNTMDFVGSGVTYRIENGAILTNSLSGSFLAGRLGTLGFQTYGSTTRYNAIGNVYTDNNTSGLALFYKSASVDIEGMRLTSIGRVGIGTTVPSASLHISGTSASTLFEIDSPSTNNILFVSGSGRIGIGTGTPLYGLDVNSDGRFVGNVRFDVGLRDNRDNTFIAQSTSSLISNRTLTIGNATYSSITFPNGNVGIGTSTPSFTLDVSGSGRFTDNVTITGSLNVTGGITGSLLGTASYATQALSASYVLNAISSSFASTASFVNPLNQNITLVGNQTITGSLTITNNLTVLGSASIQFISESTLNIGTNLITVNTFTPSIRFGGLAVIDSGSSPLTSASFLYDSVHDEFIFVHKGDGTNITSSHFLVGPQTYNDLGNEIYITSNALLKSEGNEHITSSNITDTGTLVNINSNTTVTGSLIVSSSNATQLQVGNNLLFVSSSGNVGIGTNNPTYTLYVSGSAGNTAAFEGGSSQTTLLLKQGANLNYIVGLTNNISFRPNGTEALYLRGSNSSVGIGTQIPTSLLHISGASSAALFEIDSPAINNILFVSGSGRIGIGTGTPTQVLDVSGSIRASTPSAEWLLTPSSTYSSIGGSSQGASGSLIVNPQTDFNQTYAGITIPTGTTLGAFGGGQYVNIGSFNAAGGGVRYFSSLNGSVHSHTWYHNKTTQLMSLSYRGNLEIGGSTIDLNLSRLLVRGSGTTSATTALRIENSSAAPSMVVLDNGNVGIGTTAPSASLHISGANTLNSASFLVQNSSGQTLISALNNRNVNINYENAVDGDTGIGTTNGTITLNRGYNNTISRNALTFYAGGAASTIQGFNNVPGIAIGYAQTATNPNTGSALTIRGTAATSGSGVLFVTGSSSTTLLRLSSEVSSSILVVSGSGNVGIGTDNPTSPLHVRSANTIVSVLNMETPTNAVAFSFNGSRSGFTYAGGGGAFFNPIFGFTGNNIQIGLGNLDASARLHVRGAGATSSTTALRVENSNASASLVVLNDGNVGIGEASPLTVLDVRASSNTTITPLSSVPNTATTVLIGNTGTNGVLAIGHNNTGQAWLQARSRLANAAANSLLINPLGGNVGIGRTPTSSLDVAGTTRLSSSFNTAISGSTLTVIGSGSAQPIFTVQGSQGELFSITDSLSGSLFSVNDISGLPIMEVFSDNTILMGDYQDPMLLTTRKIAQTNSGSFVVYSIPTASYDGAFIDYTIKSGSNARAGTIMSTWAGSSIEFTEVDTMDIGSTAAVGLTMILSGSNAVMTGSSSTGAWTIRTIIRTI